MHGGGRIPNRDLPRPRKIVDGPDGAMHYHVPIALEGYKDGYNSMVQDEYERVITMLGNGRVKSKDWVLRRRVRIFTKPAHYGLDGEPFRCEECEEHWAKRPSMEPEVIAL